LPRKKIHDPLAWVPTPNVIRQRLDETLMLAKRLHILLELAEKLRLADTAADRPAPSTHEPKGGTRG